MTKTSDLRKMVEADNAEKNLTVSKNKFKSFADSQSWSNDQVIESYRKIGEATTVADETHKKFIKIGPAKRDAAKVLHKKLEDYGMFIASQGGYYSGSVSQTVFFQDRPSAHTTVSSGEQYSRGCTYRKNDADHIVEFNMDNAKTLDANWDIVELSKKDSLYIIDIKKLKSGAFECVWVTIKNKQIVSEKGYVAKIGDMLYHSTKSEKHALDGIKRKHTMNKKNSRENVLNRLKNSSEITMGDVRKLTGWCSAGCKAWVERYMDGKSRAKREEVVEAAKKAKDNGDTYAPRLLDLLGV